MSPKRKELQVVVEDGGPMPEAQFQAWLTTLARAILQQNAIDAKTDFEILEDQRGFTVDQDPIYINRGDSGFVKYEGTRDNLASTGWPTLFPGRLKTNQPVSVASALRFLHRNDKNGLNLVSMDEPDAATWDALERFVASEHAPS